MKKVELILCYDDETWEAGKIVEIPDHLHQLMAVDEIAAWVQENIEDAEGIIFERVVYIGVFNWDAGGEEE